MNLFSAFSRNLEVSVTYRMEYLDIWRYLNKEIFGNFQILGNSEAEKISELSGELYQNPKTQTMVVTLVKSRTD